MAPDGFRRLRRERIICFSGTHNHLVIADLVVGPTAVDCWFGNLDFSDLLSCSDLSQRISEVTESDTMVMVRVLLNTICLLLHQSESGCGLPGAASRYADSAGNRKGYYHA